MLESMRDNVPDLEYGGRACVDAETRGEVLTKLDGQSYKLSAGGSLSNTLVALSRMTAANSNIRQDVVEEENEQSTDVSIACSLGPDPLGEFYRTKLKKAGVQVSKSSHQEFRIEFAVLCLGGCTGEQISHRGFRNKFSVLVSRRVHS